MISDISPRSAERLATLRRSIVNYTRCLFYFALLAVIGLGVVLLVGCHFWAWSHFRAGQTALQRHHYAEAYMHGQACQKVWPHDRNVLLLTARAAWGLRAWDESEKWLQECQRQDGVLAPQEDVSLEWVLLRAASGQVDQVQQLCQDLLRQNHPASPRILEALAAGYMCSYRLHQAKECLMKWLAWQPDDAHALYLLGCIQDYLHEPGALAKLRRAVELDAEHDEARLNLARLLSKEEPSQALSHLEYLSQRKVDNPQLLILMAQCCNLLGRHTEAIQFLDQLLQRYPDCVEALVERGRLEMQVRQLAAAEDYFRQALRRAPGHYMALYNLKICLEQQGKIEEADRYRQRLQQAQEDVQRIEEIVNRRMLLTPHDPALYQELGEIFLRQGNEEQGLSCLYRALEQNPRYEAARCALADYYQRKGDKERAAYLRLALQPR
jgi:tetratricopeptide (TPR) repeat protein